MSLPHPPPLHADLTVGDYVRTLKWGLAEVVFEWAKGVPFVQLYNYTDIEVCGRVRRGFFFFFSFSSYGKGI